MLTDKSLFHYGKIYNKLLDPLIKPARKVLVDCIPADSSVLDIGCGTGLLCFDLKREKGCQVVGIDHYTQFKKFKSMGGIVGILDGCGLSLRIKEQLIFFQGCNHLFVVSK